MNCSLTHRSKEPVFEEWFEGRIKRTEWGEVFQQVPYMQKFRATMFKRLIPAAWV